MHLTRAFVLSTSTLPGLAMLPVFTACGDAQAESVAQTTSAAPVVARAEFDDRVEAVLELHRGLALDGKAEEAERLAHFERGLELDPESVVLRFKVAWSRWLAGDFEEAASDYGEIAGPQRGNAILWQAHSLLAAGDVAGARRAYEARAEATTPVYWGPVALPGEASPSDARLVLHWSREAKRHEASPLHHWAYGNALANASRFVDAAEAYRRALELDPALDLARAALAMTELRKGDPKAAGRVVAEMGEDFGRTALGAFVGLRVATDLGNRDRVVEYGQQYLEATGRAAEISVLVLCADAALATENDAAGIRFLDEAFVVRGTTRRAIFGGGDEESLAALSRQRLDTALEHYAYASSLYGYMVSVVEETTRTTNFLLLGGAIEYLDRINSPTREELARYGDMSQEIDAATQNFDMGRAMAAQFLAQFQPHYGRVIREARAAVAAAPSFLAAKVLLATALDYVGETNEADAILEEILAERADATSIRLWLSYRTPLERAYELLAELDPRDELTPDCMARRAGLDDLAGESELAATRALDFIGLHREAWDMEELVAFHLEASGEYEKALELLENSARGGRTARGAMLRAELRDALGRGDAVLALIDAWRAAPAGSTEERRATNLLNQKNTRPYVCGRCNGGGRISVTQGNTGEYGSIRTYDESCPKCLGLGLWAAGVL